ncbi:ketoacyl-ACP synthase III [bacterium]|nr:ketoacyl-ACP synthase III [bacterium]
MYKARIIGTGSYLPEKILTNSDLEKMVDTNDEWIITRTGIRQRRIAADNQATSDLALEASKKALITAGLKPEEIELLVVATITPDMPFPSTACVLQAKLGAKNAVCFDLNAACTGFIYGLSCVKQYLQMGTYKTALVVAAETLSSVTDWQDRNTCILFGDGAGAAVLRREETQRGLMEIYLNSDGNYQGLLNMPAGGSRIPATENSVKERLHFLKMKGNEVFKIAIQSMIKAANEVVSRNNLKWEDVKFIIPHQANTRIINAVAKRVGVSMERVFLNIHKYGNMSAATTAVGLDEVIREKDIKEGDLLMLVAFGAGFTSGACLIRW